MNADKDIPEVLLLSVNFEKITSINLYGDKSQTSVWSAVIGPAMSLYYNVNFKNLMDSHRNHRINFISINYQHCEISYQIIECKIFWFIVVVVVVVVL